VPVLRMCEYVKYAEDPDVQSNRYYLTLYKIDPVRLKPFEFRLWSPRPNGLVALNGGPHKKRPKHRPIPAEASELPTNSSTRAHRGAPEKKPLIPTEVVGCEAPTALLLSICVRTATGKVEPVLAIVLPHDK
jgi:hypothetical protein